MEITTKKNADVKGCYDTFKRKLQSCVEVHVHNLIPNTGRSGRVIFMEAAAYMSMSTDGAPTPS